MWSIWAHIQHQKSIFKLRYSPVVFNLPFLWPCIKDTLKGDCDFVATYGLNNIPDFRWAQGYKQGNEAWFWLCDFSFYIRLPTSKLDVYQLKVGSIKTMFFLLIYGLWWELNNTELWSRIVNDWYLLSILASCRVFYARYCERLSTNDGQPTNQWPRKANSLIICLIAFISDI